jgi:hypothetical protein
MRYCAFGRIIESERPLPELSPAGALTGPCWTIAWRDRLDLPDDLGWHAVWPELQSQPEVAFARAGRFRYLRFEHSATARISDEVIEIAADPGEDPAALRHTLLDFILPLALASAGEMVLHASAVEIDGAAVVILGDAGSGKSTLAAALSALGAGVLADDGVLLRGDEEQAWAVPSYPGLRLWPDAAERARARGFSMAAVSAGTRKRRLIPFRGCRTEGVPLACAYVLQGGGTGVEFARLSRRDAAVALVRHAFTPDIRDRSALVSHLERAAAWSRRLEMWTVTSRRDLTALEAFARSVMAHAGRRASVRLQTR